MNTEQSVLMRASGLVREEGLEPSWTFSHPQEPESCASANFAILANDLLILSYGVNLVKTSEDAE